MSEPQSWRKVTIYAVDSDFVFASERGFGKMPIWSNESYRNCPDNILLPPAFVVGSPDRILTFISTQLAFPRMRWDYHVIVTRLTPCRGKDIGTTSLPSLASTMRSGPSDSRRPARSSAEVCSGVGRCGDPIFFHTA
jgi:hypothetical protein